MSAQPSAVSLSFSFLYLMFQIPRVLLASGRHSEHGLTRGDVQYLGRRRAVIFERMTFAFPLLLVSVPPFPYYPLVSLTDRLSLHSLIFNTSRLVCLFFFLSL